MLEMRAHILFSRLHSLERHLIIAWIRVGVRIVTGVEFQSFD